MHACTAKLIALRSQQQHYNTTTHDQNQHHRSVPKGALSRSVFVIAGGAVSDTYALELASSISAPLIAAQTNSKATLQKGALNDDRYLGAVTLVNPSASASLKIPKSDVLPPGSVLVVDSEAVAQQMQRLQQQLQQQQLQRQLQQQQQHQQQQQEEQGDSSSSRDAVVQEVTDKVSERLVLRSFSVLFALLLLSVYACCTVVSGYTVFFNYIALQASHIACCSLAQYST
jgi:hypothetical protein